MSTQDTLATVQDTNGHFEKEQPCPTEYIQRQGHESSNTELFLFIQFFINLFEERVSVSRNVRTPIPNTSDNCTCAFNW